jgi:hypothetical protein
MGTHEELIKKPGLYKRIFDIQTRMVWHGKFFLWRRSIIK